LPSVEGGVHVRKASVPDTDVTIGQPGLAGVSVKKENKQTGYSTNQ